MSGKKRSFYTELILKLMAPMKEGYLLMELPDGEKLHFGSKEASHHADIKILNEDFFKRCALYGDVGFGEAYVDGEWETTDLAALVEWMILNVENHPILMDSKPKRTNINFFKIFNKFYHLARVNTVKGSKKNISEHYDLSNDFFKLFLDPSMTYSSAYFKNAHQSLEEAQIEKYDRLAKKLELKPEDHVLEIGSGWGGFAVHAAKNYGARVTTVTISEEQYKYARERFKKEGLADRIDIKLTDYRHISGHFDKIVSIEMIEAVGHDFLKVYFGKCHALLKKKGILALQMITCPDHRYESFRKNVDWIQKHIFPGGLLPSFAAVQDAVNKTGDLGLYDFEDMTPSYARTLYLWRKNFNHQKEKVRSLGFGDAFLRKWNYYFAYCEAAFRMRNISVVQAVYTRPNNHGLKEKI